MQCYQPKNILRPEIMENSILLPEPNWISCLPSKQEIAKRLNVTAVYVSQALENRLANKRSKTPRTWTDKQKLELEKMRLEVIEKLQNNCKMQSI